MDPSCWIPSLVNSRSIKKSPERSGNCMFIMKAINES